MLGIFIDLETTGLDWHRHRVLEIAIKILDLNSGAVIGSLSEHINHSLDVFQAADPVSLEVNGWTLEGSSTGKSESEVSRLVLELFDRVKIHRSNAFFIGQNPSFDRPFFSEIVAVYRQEKLQWPYHWLDLASMYWSMKVRQLSQETLPIPERTRLSKDVIAFRAWPIAGEKAAPGDEWSRSPDRLLRSIGGISGQEVALPNKIREGTMKELKRPIRCSNGCGAAILFQSGGDVKCMQSMHNLPTLVGFGNRVQGVGRGIDDRSGDDAKLGPTGGSGIFLHRCRWHGGGSRRAVAQQASHP